jgi:SAM-dependent methyltransferase
MPCAPVEFLLQPATRQAQAVLHDVLLPGDIAIDATCGNGHDTAFLAEHVGADGHVIGFDIQREALTSTRKRLPDALQDRVTLVEASHAEMLEHLPPDVAGRVRAVMFNLGYLPGGDKTLITRPDTSVAAIHTALELLGPNGVVTIVVYTGHEGGREEAEHIETFLKTLPKSSWDVRVTYTLNREVDAPYLIVISRMSR